MAIGCPLPNGSSGVSLRGSEALPDPFCDIASLAMPASMTDALRWGDRVFERLPIYRSAVERIVSYFITEVQIDGDDKDEKQRAGDFLNNDLGIKSVLFDAGLDLHFSGNSFISALTPIKRYLACPHCHLERPLSEVSTKPDYRYMWSNFQFTAHCPRCERHGSWKQIPRKASSDPQLIIKRWSPLDIEIVFDPLTERCAYIWKISPTYRDQIRRGDPLILEGVDWSVVEAVRDNKWIRFDDGVIYHMKERKLASQENRGWGISRALTNLGVAYYVQMLHRYNEALAMDYVIPFRLITPDIKGGPVEQEPAFQMGMSNFSASVSRMVRQRRTDPTRWNVLPFPVKYQALGGDATAFAPRDLLDQGYDVLLNSIGCPVEFYKGSLAAAAALPALRFFESHHAQFRDLLGGLLRFISKAVAERMKWEPFEAKLLKPTHADDITRQQLKLQLGINKQVSQTTALKSIGVDFEEEERRKIEEQRTVAELTAKAQEEMDQQTAGDALFQPLGAAALAQQAQQGQQGQPPGGAGQPPQPGMASAGAGLPTSNLGAPQTPEDYQASAEQLAQQLLPLDETTRKRQLSQLKQQDPVLQQLVVSALAKLRNDMRSQGGAMLMQQAGGAAPPPGA